MKIFLKIIQESLKLFLFFLIPYIWISLTQQSKTFSIILSISISIFLEILSLLISKNKKNNLQLKLSQQSDAEQMFLSLLLDRNPLDFYYNLFQTRHQTVIKKTNYLIVKTHDNKNLLFHPFLKLSPLTEDDLISISKLDKKIDKIMIICNLKSASCNDYISKIKTPIEIFDKYQTYSHLYQEYDFFPVITREEKIKTSFKSRLKIIFSKSKIKGYVLAGLIVLISSIYSPFSLYYKIIASLLFLFAIICLLYNGTKKEQV